MDDPTLVKTVSNKTVSLEKVNLWLELVSVISFLLHENTMVSENSIPIPESRYA